MFLALLDQREKWFSVKELAELAKVPRATASETLTALERLDWVSSRGQGPAKERRLSDPTALLDEWTRQALAAPAPTTRRFYVPATEAKLLPERLASAFEAYDVEYVMTQEAAAQLYAPLLSIISRIACRITPGQSANAGLSNLEARVVRKAQT